MSELGWRGKPVRNADGRQGRITGEHTVFSEAQLTITVDGGEKATVRLNSDGPDAGELGWEWLCEEFSGGARWLPLGDHNSAGQAQGKGATHGLS